MNKHLHATAWYLSCGLAAWGLFAGCEPARAEADGPRAAPARETVAARTDATRTDAVAPAHSDETPRDAARRLLRATHRVRADLPHEVVKELVAVYVELQADEQLPASERDRLSSQVRRRLRRISTAIARDLRRGARQSLPERGTKSAPSSPSAEAFAKGSRGAGGGAPQDESQALIDLIESTIAPDTWDVSGGQGTIKYWQPGMALVVRQTSEVHGQVGELVQNLAP